MTPVQSDDKAFRARVNRTKTVKNEAHEQKWEKKTETEKKRKSWSVYTFCDNFSFGMGPLPYQLATLLHLWYFHTNKFNCVYVCVYVWVLYSIYVFHLSCYAWNGDHVCSALWLFAIHIWMLVRGIFYFIYALFHVQKVHSSQFTIHSSQFSVFLLFHFMNLTATKWLILFPSPVHHVEHSTNWQHSKL